MTTMQLQTISTAGTPPTFAPVSASDTLPFSAGSTLIVRNVSNAAVTITLVTPGNLPTGDAYPDKEITCDPGTGSTNEVATEVWIPLSKEYVDPTTGHITVTYSAQTNVSAALVAL